MSSTLVPAESTPPWLDLPREITAMILHKLGALEILTTAEKVCPTWRSVCMDVAMWRSIEIRNDFEFSFKNLLGPRYGLEKLCLCAVDRSRGQLIDITLKHFATDDLLLYIFQGSNQLKCLQLVSCAISGEGLIQAVKKQPQLEELHLYHTPIDTETIEVVGRCCPYLKSFKFNGWGYRLLYRACNLVAFAVAQNMKELRHLGLCGNKMTNEGLQAILDGCPHLESLDLRMCYNLWLVGDFGRMCFQRIKYLRHNCESADKRGFDTDRAL